MRRFLILLLCVPGACATPMDQTTSRTARFPNYPTELFAAFKKSCSEPAQTFLRQGPNQRECREFLPPEPTALAILKYDGHTDDLPQLVIRISTRPDAKEHLVTIETYLDVPQKSGGSVHVIFPSPQYDWQMASLFEMAGGIAQ